MNPMKHVWSSPLLILLALFIIPSAIILGLQTPTYPRRNTKGSLTSETSFSIQRLDFNVLLEPLQMCQVVDDLLTNSTEVRNQTYANYSKKDVMLNVAKQSPSAAYRVELPKGMSYPTLTAKEQIVADRVRESLKEDSSKTDLDLLKEELRIMIEKLG